MDNETIKAVRGNKGIKGPKGISFEEELVYDQEDAIDFIAKKFRLKGKDDILIYKSRDREIEGTVKQILTMILEAEEDYMKSIGIIE